ncbi:MAG: aldo/keto reductase family protein [Blastocatellia bacterium]
MIEQRRAGRSDIFVSRLGLGCVTFGREIDEVESFRLLDQAVDGGTTLLDTAEGYGGGNAQLYRQKTLGVSDVREKSGELHSSEKIIGRWLRARGNREQVVIQTKFSGGYSKAAIRRALSAVTGLPMARLALGWTLSNQAITSVLIGATTPAHIANGFDALQLRFQSDWFI